MATTEDGLIRPADDISSVTAPFCNGDVYLRIYICLPTSDNPTANKTVYNHHAE